MGDARRGEDGLRAILLRSRDARLVFTAAYNLASSLRRQGRLDKAAAYAARALERATAVALPELMAPAHNLLANILLNRYELDPAIVEYTIALDLLGVGGFTDPFLRAIVLDNLGYCRLLQRRLDEGLGLIRQALSLAEDTGDCRCQAECHQDLCYGLLMRDDDLPALVEGERALAIAQEKRFADIAENCHYLLGELGRRTGNIEMQDRHFGILQKQHPELPFLKDFLCAVDVMGIITLKR
jgi:tetratricopeptide (TPR) repeat protein